MIFLYVYRSIVRLQRYFTLKTEEYVNIITLVHILGTNILFLEETADYKHDPDVLMRFV